MTNGSKSKEEEKTGPPKEKAGTWQEESMGERYAKETKAGRELAENQEFRSQERV